MILSNGVRARIAELAEAAIEEDDEVWYGEEHLVGMMLMDPAAAKLVAYCRPSIILALVRGEVEPAHQADPPDNLDLFGAAWPMPVNQSDED